MLVAPVTFQFSVDDWPRSIDVGSAVNDATTGAAGGGGAGCSTGAGGGGGGGGGAFFLQPAANIASVRQIPIEVILRLFSMNKFLLKSVLGAACWHPFYLAHTGVQFFPAVVNCLS